MTDVKMPSFGEKLVGISFNPAGDPKVLTLKY